ncbi:MAG TPA: CHASE domain-containing protein [Baekduia sp.]|uniref:CHASE domain-containing protein n=1 Tax=Baekduia sp. TaxID=2600305 RepID=UPI002D766BA5|nr:CHASE domain-containing protein [Baekduia sp.]HET6509398.1 CHASE domain-containing protein [Baekduia sp.]
MAPERESDGGGLARWGPAILLATLLTLTAVAVYATAVRLHDRQRDELSEDARDTTAAIGRRMDDYEQILRGAAGLYNASADVSYRDFHNYFADQDVMRRFPGVQVIGFASYVPRAGLAAHTREVNRQTAASGLDYPRFEAHPEPSADTQELLVIDHLEPPPGNSAAFGLDFLSEANRRRAALLARRTGEPAATAPISLIQSRGSSLGIDLMVPVYGSPPSQTGAPRQWTGVVYAAFRLDNLLRGVLGPSAAGTELEVYDVGPSATTPADAPITRDAVAFDLRPGRAQAALTGGGAHTRIRSLAVAGRRWAIVYHRSGTTLSAGERAVPWVIGIAGVLVSLLAAALLASMASARRRAVRLADAMTVELREREAQLRESNAELEHFAYLASHDLQEPLRTITSYVGLLESRVGDQLDDRARSWLGFVSEGAGRMSQLIADLLEYSRTGRGRDDTETVDLEQAWDLAVANLQHAIADAGATVRREPLPAVRAHPREMTSMLQNLIGNGLKYRRDGVAPVVRASARRDGDGRWEIAIADNGIGIEPRFHDRVFGLFQRLHTAEEYPGTGMGLAIVKKIAESNGGSIRVESEPGAGATFIVTLQGEEG